MNLHPLEKFGFAGVIVALLLNFINPNRVVVGMVAVAGVLTLYGQDRRHKALLKKWKERS